MLSILLFYSWNNQNNIFKHWVYPGTMGCCFWGEKGIKWLTKIVNIKNDVSPFICSKDGWNTRKIRKYKWKNTCFKLESQNKECIPAPFKVCECDKNEKENKNWKNVSECVSEKNGHFIKTIVLPVNKTNPFEFLKNERIINLHYTALVSNMSGAGWCFSKSIYKKIWKI